MQSNQPLLTIAIPTYNRQHYLNILLSLLEPQSSAETRLELIISDNASTDDTETLVRQFIRNGMHCRYIRNESNLGADGNILQCFMEASGKYVWILGDDDVVASKAVTKILGYLETGEYDLVYINSFGFEEEYSFSQSSKLRQPTEFKDVKIFSSMINVFFTFISANLINKNRICEGVSPEFESLVGTNLVQLGWMYAALNRFQCGLYIHEKLVGGRSNNTGGYKLFQVFGPALKAITLHRLKDKALQRVIINGTLMRFWPVMLLGYKLSSQRFEIDAKPSEVLTLAFRKNIRFWIFVYPIFVTPFLFGRMWLLTTRFFCKLDEACGYVFTR